MSAAVLLFIRKESAESYSFEGVGAHTRSTLGLAFSYIGIKISFQIFESSVRHESITSVVFAATAGITDAGIIKEILIAKIKLTFLILILTPSEYFVGIVKPLTEQNLALRPDKVNHCYPSACSIFLDQT